MSFLQRYSRKSLACLHRATFQILKAKINWMEKLKYEGQGKKISILKNVKNRDFQFGPILASFAEDDK